MNNRRNSKDMVSTKSKSKVLSCSTPEHHGDSPSRDSDSTICDSECASPVPFLCTQDGAEGETDVVWNFYTPKSGNSSSTRDKNSTPLSRRSKKSFRPKAIEKQIPKRRPVRPSQKNTQLFQELYELNQNLHELIRKKPVPEKTESGSEEDIFKTQDCSPKCVPRSNSHCLRKNVLSSNFGKPDPDTALESDDSMNECLLKASQIVEDKILNSESVISKKSKYENRQTAFRTDPEFKLDSESMDALINISMKMASPMVNKIKCESNCINNDSFDNFVGNLNDSALEELTQMPIKADLNSNSRAKDWTVKEMVVHDGSPLSRSFLSRHNSMPASPSIHDLNKPSTSGMTFGRFSSMPFQNEDNSGEPDSPIRCTPDEIKKKHQLAREKLMAKRLLPFTQQTQSLPTQPTQPVAKKQFQPRTASSNDLKSANNITTNSMANNVSNNGNNKIQLNNVMANNGNVPKSSIFQPRTAASSLNTVSINNVMANSTVSANLKSNLQTNEVKGFKSQFQPKTAICSNVTNNNTSNTNTSKQNGNPIDLKQLIEKKRQEALMKLRRRQPQNK